MNIFVARLDYGVRAVFEDFGEVDSANVIMDKMTGRSKGFGFVEMENEEDAQRAINELNGTSLRGREIVVKVAESRERSNDRRSPRY